MPLFIRLFKVSFVWVSPGFVHSDNSSKKVITFPLVPVQQGLCDCIAVTLLHLRNLIGYPKCYKLAVTQNVMQNIAHGFVTYFDFHYYLMRSPSAISIQQESKKLNCVVLHLGPSCMEGFLNGISSFSECFNPSCHCAILQHCIATCFMQSLKTFLCTTTSCHFNFDPGTLL